MAGGHDSGSAGACEAEPAMTRSTRIDILCALARKGGRLPSAPGLSPSVEPRKRVSPASPLQSPIAGALLEILCGAAMIAIAVVTFNAIGRL